MEQDNLAEKEETPSPLKEGTSPDKLQDLVDAEAKENSLPPAFEMELGEGESLYTRLDEMNNDLMSDFNARDNWRTPYEDQLWYDEYRLFWSNQLLTKTPTRAKVFVPIVNQIVQIATSKLVGFVSGSDDLFDVDTPSQLDENIAKNIELLIEDQLSQNKFDKKFTDFVTQLLLYGTSYFAVDWEEKWAHVYEDVTTIESVTDEVTGEVREVTKTEPTKKYKCVANRPRLTVLDILDVFPAQNYQDIDDMPGIFIRRWMNVSEFRDMLKNSDYFGNEAVASKLEGSEKFQGSRQYRKVSRGEMSTVKFDQIELLEFWGPFDLDGDGIKEECQIVIANREVVVRAVPNPFHHQKRPVVKASCINIPMEFYGMSLVQPVLALQEEVNTVRRQKLDMTSLSINRMWKVNIGSNIEESQLVSRPNGVIYVEEMDDIALVEPVQVPTDAWTDSNLIVQDMMNVTVPQSLTGTASDLRGANQPGTARINVTQALEKFATIAKNIEDQALVPMLEMMYQLDLQYLNDSRIIRAFYGNLFSNPDLVSPAMIRTQAEFRMKALSEMTSKDIKINQLLALFQTAGQVVDANSQNYILKQLVDLMGFDSNQISVQGPVMQSLPGGQVPLPGLGPIVPPAQGLPAPVASPGAGATPASLGVRSPNLPIA